MSEFKYLPQGVSKPIDTYDKELCGTDTTCSASSLIVVIENCSSSTVRHGFQVGRSSSTVRFPKYSLC